MGLDLFAGLVPKSLMVVILSKVAGETAAGLLNAAFQVVVPTRLLIGGLVDSAFPLIVRRAAAGVAELRKLLENLIELSAVILLPSVVGLAWQAEPILRFVFRDPDFQRAAPLVPLIGVGVAFSAASAVLGRALIAVNRETIVLRIVLVSVGLCLALGFGLVARFGSSGAALGVAAVWLLSALLQYLECRRFVSSLSVVRAIWQPVAAAALMGLAVVMLPYMVLPVAVFMGAVIYALALTLVAQFSPGGVGGLWQRTTGWAAG